VPAAQVLLADLPGQAQERPLRRLAPEHGRRDEVLLMPLEQSRIRADFSKEN
jgi:hypothetical protein